VILRFFVGIGMAFFFGPSVVLISSYLGKGSEGLGIGILNSAHSLGGIIGIFGWIAIAEFVGWRTSLILSGALGLVSGFFLIYSKKQEQTKNKNKQKNRISLTNHLQNPNVNQGHVKNENTQTKFKIKLEDLKTILTNKSIILIGFSLLGIQIGWNLISTFIVIYLKNQMNANSIIAGLIAGLPMLFNVIVSPMFGKIYDKANKKTGRNYGMILFIISSLIVSSNIAFISIDNIYTITLSIILIGIFISGGFVVPYTKAREITTANLGLPPQYETLAISFINGLSLFGAFWAPFVFSNIAKYLDYALAWLIGGIITFVFVIPILFFMKKNKFIK
jgi:MFS family permease